MFRFFLLSVLVVVLSGVVRPGETLPASYDQRQDGHLNVHAKLENLLFVVVPTKKQMNNLADLAGLLAGSRSEQSLMRHRIVLKGQQDEEFDATDDAYRIEVVDLRTQQEDKKDNIENKVQEIREEKEETKLDSLSTAKKNLEEEKHKEPYRVEIVNLREDKIDSKEQGEKKIESPSAESQKIVAKESETSIKLGTLALPLAGKDQSSSIEEHRKEPYKVEIVNLDQTAENNVKNNPSEEPKFEVVIVEGAKDEARKAKQYGLFDTIRTMYEEEQERNDRLKNRMVDRAFKEVNVRSPIKTKKPEVDKKYNLKRKNENEGSSPSSSSSSNGRRLEHHEYQELKLIGDGIENCGPLRHRNKAGICVFD